VLRGSAVPYGYTLTVWTSGMMLTRQRGMPSVGEVFLSPPAQLQPSPCSGSW
jgi:hypothetical protein